MVAGAAATGAAAAGSAAAGAAGAAAAFSGSGAFLASTLAASLPRDMASSCAIRSRSSPFGSSPSSASSSARIPLIRSMVWRIRLTAFWVTGAPSRNLPIKVSAACASASRRGRPRNPQVPLMVCTRRKMLSRMRALFGSCSNFTSSTSTTSRDSLVSVRNSRSRSSIGHPRCPVLQLKDGPSRGDGRSLPGSVAPIG